LKLPVFSCDDTAQCGASGVCEPNGLCSFVDEDCASGRRFGEHQGELSNTCVVEIPDPCPNDLDCDGVVDADDNCPVVANEDQFNEDGDARGDACDLCPPFEDTGEDTDGDGVGDDCDPHPGLADTIVEFVGFEEMPAGWTVVNNVTVVGGVARLSANANAVSMLVRDQPAGPDYVIWAELHHDAFAGGGALGAAGLMVQHAPDSDDSGGLCQLVGTATMGMEELRLFDTSNGGALLLDSGAHPLDIGEVYELYFERDGDDMSCFSGNPDLEVQGASTFAPANPEVGLRVRSATSSYRWVMIVKPT
jgi:hypothetical protein